MVDPNLIVVDLEGPNSTAKVILELVDGQFKDVFGQLIEIVSARLAFDLGFVVEEYHPCGQRNMRFEGTQVVEYQPEVVVIFLWLSKAFLPVPGPGYLRHLLKELVTYCVNIQVDL